MATKKQIYRRRRIMLVLGCFIILSFFIGSIFLTQYKQYKELLEQREDLVQELDKVKEENERLKSDVAFANTIEFVEYMARQLLGWVKPNETKYVD